MPGPILATAADFWAAVGVGALVLAMAISLVARMHPYYLASAATMDCFAVTRFVG